MAGPSVEFWGGIGTIGGTVAMVRDGAHRVILDLGLTYAPGGGYYDGRVQPRPRAVLREYLALGSAPPISGLYRRDLLAGAALRSGPSEPPTETAAFISHLHLDHYGLAGLTAPGIPIWLTAESLRLYQALRETGEQLPGLPRPFSALPAEPVAVGPLRVAALPVDHDLPGACGFAVETAAGAVVYTGDLRLHGHRPELTEQFIRTARAMRPAALIIEGTRLHEGPDRPPGPREPEVAPLLANALAGCPGLAVVNVYPRNVERIAGLLPVAAAAGRRLALEPAVAYLFGQMGGSLTELALYVADAQREELVRGRAPAWLERLLQAAQEAGAPVVGAGEVRADQTAFLLQLSYPALPELVDLQPARGSIWVQSGGEPLGRFDPAYANLERWLDRFRVKLLPLQSSGHAAPADLERIVAEVDPEVVVPIHSLAPERLPTGGRPRLLPEYAASYELGALVR